MSSVNATENHRRRLKRAANRAAGLCPEHGTTVAPGKRSCQECIDRDSIKRGRRKACGLCYCGRPRDTANLRCSGCLKSLRKALAKSRAANIANGLCPCGNAPRPGKGNCERCFRGQRSRARRRVAAGLCRCGKREPAPGKAGCAECLNSSAKEGARVRAAAISGYGGVCVCCGEADPNVLELDHVNNDGSQHRREVGPSMYRWALRNGFPPRLQLLCANCHSAKTRTGDCSYRAAKK
jgi:hypothetical protein